RPPARSRVRRRRSAPTPPPCWPTGASPSRPPPEAGCAEGAAKGAQRRRRRSARNPVRSVQVGFRLRVASSHLLIGRRALPSLVAAADRSGRRQGHPGGASLRRRAATLSDILVRRFYNQKTERSLRLDGFE